MKLIMNLPLFNDQLIVTVDDLTQNPETLLPLLPTEKEPVQDDSSDFEESTPAEEHESDDDLIKTLNDTRKKLLKAAYIRACEKFSDFLPLHGNRLRVRLKDKFNYIQDESTLTKILRNYAKEEKEPETAGKTGTLGAATTATGDLCAHFCVSLVLRYTLHVDDA